jgi:hypothetical protein
MAAFFLSKYSGRTDKVKEPSLKFWWADNWPELVISTLLVTMVMILLLMGAFEFKIAEWLQSQDMPFIVVILPRLASSAIIGWFGTAVIYKVVSKKAKV